MGVCESRKQAFANLDSSRRESYQQARLIHFYLLAGNPCPKVAIALLETV